MKVAFTSVNPEVQSKLEDMQAQANKLCIRAAQASKDASDFFWLAIAGVAIAGFSAALGLHSQHKMDKCITKRDDLVLQLAMMADKATEL